MSKQTDTYPVNELFAGEVRHALGNILAHLQKQNVDVIRSTWGEKDWRKREKECLAAMRCKD